ncbi:MAG TPA: YiiX/YebB-like N1pC/P60 family cysteine hydrolase [Candidatus Binataceae bacterium]|nr:YiiX/YebB-like N1pC/P60 family cysteine hydrolase [Candidatus Binataceae bacterium]
MRKPTGFFRLSSPISRLRRRIITAFLSILTKPIKRYTLTIPNDLAALERHVRKGDVILVEGNQRISECIKYLTQSSWSHAALYVGDEPLHHSPELRQRLIDEFGEEDARHMLVEALVERGVVLTPLRHYAEYNIRICRPYHLKPGDLAVVLARALASVGRTYDLRNVFDLGRYFFPVSVVPPRLGREALHFGSGEPTRVICSSMIAECFEQVRFPILPVFEPYPEGHLPAVASSRWQILRRRRSPHGVFRTVSPSLITPRDFDLSPYFAIVKFNVIEDMRFDYRKMVWVEAEPARSRKLDKSA